ncbi:hypothetical protein V1478_015071 [Vespula squamosa]|uniref:Uncharacterized protein n=1 Tax=Vespula squamosa TaxID=30214 RepID=A0ABD2A422_VESSQ
MMYFIPLKAFQKYIVEIFLKMFWYYTKKTKEEEEEEEEEEEDTSIMKQSLDDKDQPRGGTHRSFCCDSGIEILNFTVQLPKSGTSLIRESLHSKN